MSNKGLKFHPQALSTSEVEALMAACSATSPTGKRNRALIVVLWRGALRCNEALELRPHDLDPATNSLRVMFGKGARPRTIGIGPRSWTVIDVWLKARRELFAAVRAEGLHIPQDAPVFCVVSRPNTGRKLNSRMVRQFMHDYGQEAGISKRTAPHQLRHSRATEMARERKGTQAIQAALGHSNLATTDRYIRDLFPEEVIATMLDSEWDRAYGAAPDGDGSTRGPRPPRCSPHSGDETMEIPDPLPLRSMPIPREVTQVEGCDCGGMVWHASTCPLLHMPSREAGRRITVAEARERRYVEALNAKLTEALTTATTQ